MDLLTNSKEEGYEQQLRIVKDESRNAMKIFGKDEINFLDHFMSAHGIRKDPQKVGAVLNLPEPKMERGLRKFMTMCDYYWKF
ncbi:unnamed protein product [Toxocara canis]|uniref:Reverse transcriptase domain-containing protein n=1 Tax=Toxocara canis TaxID=6265 RepID=A0A183UQI8_TOXCA|nr:unnamed protein product [Toxocara canis]